MIKASSRLSCTELMNSPDYFPVSLEPIQKALTPDARWNGEARKVPPMSLVKSWAQGVIKDKFSFECECRHAQGADYLFVKASRQDMERVKRVLNDYAILCHFFLGLLRDN